MSLTPSAMLPLGTVAPDFILFDPLSGEDKSLKQLQSPVATVIMFICNHCPYVIHLESALINFANDYRATGVKCIAINANDIVNYPDDAPEKMREKSLLKHYPFPYLFDASQQTAKAYQAACTPDFYIFDDALKCTYRGRFDESSPGNGKPITGNDMRSALDAMLNGEAPSSTQLPSQGCNIKWRK